MSQELKPYFLITGSDEICEVVSRADLMTGVHGMFCCCGTPNTCDNCYLEAFKEEFKDGVDFEGWREDLEDGWLSVEQLPNQPRQFAQLERTNAALLGALKEIESHHVLQNALKGRPETRSRTLRIARAAIAEAESQKENGNG